MSQLRRFSRPPANRIQSFDAPLRGTGRFRRLPYYVAIGVLGVLALAWIDGGEEPIRPIVQQVETSRSN